MGRQRYLLAYDISDPKRLRLIHGCAKRFGYALQYSLFICDLDRTELVRLRWSIGEIIVHSVDRIAIINIGTLDESNFNFMGVRPELRRPGAWIV